MSPITRYKNLDYLLQVSGLPPAKIQEFYIFNLDDVKDIHIDMGSFTHNYFEISFSSGYDMDVSIGHKNQNVLNDKLWFLSPNQLFNWKANSFTYDAVSYTILFKPELLPFTKGAYTLYNQFPFFNRNTQSIFQLNPEQKEKIVALLKSLHQEHQKFSHDSIHIISSLLTLLLFTCKRELNTTKSTKKVSRAEKLTLQFEQLAQQTAKGKQPISYYAGKLNVSAVYLSECVKKTTGKTTKQIIDEYLIIEAKSILKHSEKSVSQIAMDLGFDDTSNFTKYFKKHTNYSPTEYKNT